MLEIATIHLQLIIHCNKGSVYYDRNEGEKKTTLQLHRLLHNNIIRN